MMDVMDQDAVFESALERRRLFGVYPAQVTDNKDPDRLGSVKVKLPWSPDSNGGSYQVWARVAVLMGGNNRGTWFIPDPNDEVLVAFEGGDPRRPYVVGMLWNGKDQPPDSMDGAGKNYRKTIRSRNGVKIVLDDTDGSESLTLVTPAGQTITLKDSPASIELQDSNGNDVKLDASGITLTTSATLTISASDVEVSAPSMTFSTPNATFTGVLQAQTVITPSVVGTTYTPGMGNIW
ncbi:phage baseplate assembly protein V [Rhodoblastus sp.]|uniref:phage baseplate assembly protein V n=1 Tax=Rhodoblastus sp. TaxID=1962975 RepID=UPI003F9BE71E